MSVVSKDELFKDLCASKEDRDEARRVFSKSYVANQIRANRVNRGWSQEDLGRIVSKNGADQQSAVVRWENPNYGRMRMETLFDLADAYDVIFWGEFISFGEFFRRVCSDEARPLVVPSFDQEKGSIESWIEVTSDEFPEQEEDTRSEVDTNLGAVQGAVNATVDKLAVGVHTESRTY